MGAPSPLGRYDEDKELKDSKEGEETREPSTRREIQGGSCAHR
jgi:hypothetical protein